MLKIGKLTDYGILLLTYLAKDNQAGSRTTRELAAESRLPLPTVEKLLKALSRGRFLASERGVKGGYRLARPADQISVAQVIETLEGPIALTECSRAAPASSCEVQSHCPVQSHWRAINEAVRGALGNLTLAQLASPAASSAPGLTVSPAAAAGSSAKAKQKVFV